MAPNTTQPRGLMQHLVGAAVLVVCLCLLPAAAAPQDTSEQWQVREYLVQRLAAEWYKIGILSTELDRMEDMLAEVRHVEVFPVATTRLTDKKLVSIDKRIESIEKRHGLLREEVDALRAPLADAISILREMVTGEAVDEMFEVLERGDMERIEHMLFLKHKISELWGHTGQLLTDAASAMEIEVPAPQEQGLENEFFEIIRANLGLEYEKYYTELSAIKDGLTQRASLSEVKQMLAVERAQVKEYLDAGRTELANRKLVVLKKRYGGTLESPELDLLLARTQFALGDYRKTVETINRLPQESQFDLKKILYTIQSLYMLRDYDRLWDIGNRLDLESLSGKRRNLVIWQVMEAGVALGHYDSQPQLASLVRKQVSYAPHVLHALAKSYVARGDWQTALSAFESARRLQPQEPIDEAAMRQIRLALAQGYYETGELDKAIALFFELLNDETLFDQALFGLVWCYIGKGQFGKAETSLRKLINQSPESGLAVEAVLTMAKRNVRKARSEWDRFTFVQEHTARLNRALDKINDKAASAAATGSSARYAAAIDTIESMLKKLRIEKTTPPSAIRSYFKKGLRICDLVSAYYATGSFQEVRFSSQREKLLHKLDSVLVAVRGEEEQTLSHVSVRSARKRNRRKIKELVRKSRVLKAEILIARYHWEQELLDWQKAQVRQRQEALAQEDALSADSAAMARAQARREELRYRLDSLVTAGDVQQSQWEQRLIDTCVALLDTDIDSTDEGYIRYQLGELYYSRENAAFMDAYQEYEVKRIAYDEQMERFRDGAIVDMPKEPVQPKLDHTNSMDQFTTVVDKFPGHEFEPAARYSLAWCYNDLGRSKQATAQMRALAAAYPDHQFAPQAWMFIGEHMFDNGSLEKAVEAYRAVMQHPESKWFDDALYKFAWTQYRLSHPQKAISSFLALVDLGGDKQRGKAILEKESMDYIAISFSESDIRGERGLERATKFVKKFGDDIKGTRILHRLARVYREQGRYEMSRKTYRTLLRMYPEYAQGPLVERELLGLLERDLPPEQLNQRKMAFFKKYNSSSEWAKAQTDPAVRSQGDSLAAQMLYDVGIAYHQVALQKNDSSYYGMAAEAYRNFIRAYPRSKRANECHYNYAEILFSVGDYHRAAEEYMAVSKRYPDSKYRETAAWNAIVASQNLLKQEKARQR